jgi:hypothetical protein
MILPAGDRDILDRISAELAADEPHLTGMYRVFSKLTFRDRIPDEDAVRRLPRRPAVGPGGSGRAGPVFGVLGANRPGRRGPGRRSPRAEAGHLARITALPALLVAILITIIAFTAGGGTHCTRAVSLHGPAAAGVSCRNGDAVPPLGNR